MSGTHAGAPADVGLVIAVKRLAAAKTRLAPVFSAATRESVVLAMLIDTISAASAVSGVARGHRRHPRRGRRRRRAGARRAGADRPDAGRPPRSAEQRARRRRKPSCATTHRTSLRCKVICPRCNRRSWPRRSSPRAAYRAASSATGTAPAPRRCSLSACRSIPRFGPDSARRHRDSGAIELTGAWPGLRCDIDTARRPRGGAAARRRARRRTQAIGRPR